MTKFVWGNLRLLWFSVACKVGSSRVLICGTYYPKPQWRWHQQYHHRETLTVIPSIGVHASLLMSNDMPEPVVQASAQLPLHSLDQGIGGVLRMAPKNQVKLWDSGFYLHIILNEHHHLRPHNTEPSARHCLQRSGWFLPPVWLQQTSMMMANMCVVSISLITLLVSLKVQATSWMQIQSSATVNFFPQPCLWNDCYFVLWWNCKCRGVVIMNPWVGNILSESQLLLEPLHTHPPAEM